MTESSFVRFLRSNLRLGAGKDVTLAAWLLCALGCGFIAYVARLHEITHDAFHEMSLFRETLVLGEFPVEDVFAYTPTVSPSVHHEWGTGAVLYFATVGSGLGLAGLALLKLLLMASLWLLLYRVARLRGCHPYVFAAIAFFAFPVFWVGFATVRAQLFTLVFIAAQLWMQELDWRGRRSWILIWLVMLTAWLNLHAGFVVGLGLIAFHSVERFATSWFTKRSISSAFNDTWHLMLAAPLAVGALGLNPYGWQYIPYLMRAIRMERPLIREWLPLWNTYSPVLTLTMFAASIALYIYAQRNSPARRLRGSAFLALSAYMAIKHIRHGSIYGVMWIAYVPAWISRTSLGKNLVVLIDRNRQGMIRTSQVVAATCFLFACTHHFWLPSLPPKPLYSSACYPTGAVEYLKENRFKGNLMTPFQIGAYVSWQMYPDVKVSFDGRYEVAYQEHIMSDHKLFMDGGNEWWKILDKYPSDAVMVHKPALVCEKLEVFRDGYVGERPKTEKQWRFVYEDDAMLILAADHCNLPSVDRRGEKLRDGAWEAFSQSHAHWARQSHPSLARGK